MRRSLAIARVAFLELATDKVLYNTALIGAGLLLLARTGAALAVLHRDRVLVDLGLAAIDLSCWAIGLLAGAGAIPKAFDTRTVILVLSRPVSRLELALGTYLGCAAIVATNWLLLSTMFAAIVAGFGEGFSPGVLLAPLALGLVQSLVVAAVAVACGSFLTSSLSVAATIVVFLGGENVSQLRSAALQADSEPVRAALRALAAALPNFEVFSMSFLTSYELPLPVGHVATAAGYGAIWIAASIGIASWLVRLRSP